MSLEIGLEKVWRGIVYQTELVSQLIIVFASAAIFGFIESWYVPTDTMSLPLWGRWSYYHLFLIGLMIVSSFSLALLYWHWIIEHKKKYVLFMCTASLPLALLLEDIFWFVARWRPIKVDEWTVVPVGWCLNLGFTYIPLWYVAVIVFAVVMFWIASVFANKGYAAFLKRNQNIK